MRRERFWRRLAEYRAGGNVAAARLVCHAHLQDDDDVAAWLALAEIEQLAGRYRAAKSAVQGALLATRRAENAGALAAVGVRLLEFNETARVAEMVHGADWSSPDVLRQSPSLVQHLWLAGDDEGALQLAEHARERIAPNAMLEYSCALVSRDTGALAAAQAGLERAIRIDPTYAPCHWSLANLAPKGGARIDRIRAALERQAVGSAEEADLRYALFKELEAQEDLSAAWTELERGARVKHALLSPRVRDRDFAALPAPPVDPLPPPEPVPQPLVFVVGMPRSGTTVVERILGNHSGLVTAGELGDFHAALCMHHDRFLDLPSLYSGYGDLAPHGDVGSLYRASVERFRKGRPVGVVDKNPANFLYAGLIAASLPEARIVCLVREPMDACFSNLKELFSGDAYPYSYDLRDLADYYGWFDRTRLQFEAALPGRFLSVDYRALVSDPEAQAARILAFCGLPHEAGCEAIERNATRVSTASSAQVRERIHARYLDGWTRYREALWPLQVRLMANGVQP